MSLSENSYFLALLALLKPRYAEITELHSNGVSEIVTWSDKYDFLESANAARKLTFNRGKFWGFIDGAKVLGDREVVKILVPKFRVLNNKRTLYMIQRGSTSEVNKLLQVIRGYPRKEIAQIFDAVVEVLRQGIDLDALLANPDPDFVKLEAITRLTYNYGYNHGVVLAVRLLRIESDAEQIANTLMKEFYDLNLAN